MGQKESSVVHMKVHHSVISGNESCLPAFREENSLYQPTLWQRVKKPVLNALKVMRNISSFSCNFFLEYV